jgi:asparagine synthase (glutamine-hydrolysing)
LWDARKRLLLLARDPVGIKPLYYARTRHAVVFGSELKSILCEPQIERRVDAHAIDRFLSHYYTPGADTPLAGIHKLPPGHYLIATDGQITIRQYWDLHFRDRKNRVSFPDAVQELQELLRRTVRDHLISDVPVGVLLSGGVDSTGVLRYAAEEAAGDIHSFTIGFEGEGFADERPYARLAARQYGTRHQDISLTANHFRDLLPRYVWHMEELVCEPPAIALYYVAELARRSGVKVLLSGEGGDEAFAGYQTYRNLMLLERAKASFGPAKPLLRASVEAAGRLGWRRLQPYSQLIDPALSDYYLSRTATPYTPFNRMKSTLYNDDFVKELRGDSHVDVIGALFAKVKDRPLLDQMLYVDTKSWLPDDLLVKADKMTMATSVELRVPLLDYQVLEFAASLPQTFKVRGWSGKRLLKEALKDSVPREILERRKAGFPVPYERWLRTELRDFVSDHLLGTSATLTNYLRKDAVRQIVEGFYARGNGSKEVFCLLVLELWLRRFVHQVQGSTASDPAALAYSSGAVAVG